MLGATLRPNAIFEVFSADQPNLCALGSAFAVSQQHAIGAFHCVGQRGSDSLVHSRLELARGQERWPARVIEVDPQLDAALIEIDNRLDPGLSPFPIAGFTARNSPFYVVGWPLNRPWPEDPATLSGKIVDLDCSIENGVPAMQLYSDQVAAGTKLDGFSGAPIVVETPDGDAAVGLVRCSISPADAAQGADGGTVFGSPMSRLVERWGNFLRACVLDCVPVPCAEIAVTYRQNELDQAWALWIAKFFDEDLGRCVYIRDWFLRPGFDYGEVSRVGLQSARTILHVISAHSATSIDPISDLELDLVKSNESARRVPIRLDSSEVPDYLRSRYPIDLSSCLNDEATAKERLTKVLEPVGRPVDSAAFPNVFENLTGSNTGEVIE